MSCGEARESRNFLGGETEIAHHYRMARARWFGVCLILAGAALSTQNKPPETIFPSEGQNPRLADGQLLDAICQSRGMAGEKMQCQSGCLAESTVGKTGSREAWTIGPVYYGHFESAASDDAVVDADGCEPHVSNFGGTILLTRIPGAGWVVKWYQGALRTGRCHKVALPNGRDMLVCLGSYAGTGGSGSDLSIPNIAHRQPGPIFFNASINNCGGPGNSAHDPVHAIDARIDKVEFLPVKGGGVPIVSVTASYTGAWIKPGDPFTCALPPAKTYRIDFDFDGRNYRPTASSATAARVFGPIDAGR
jgi:hypothetical protein